MRGFYTGGVTTAGVWGYPTRTLTQAKFPFWSAIITQTQGSVSLPDNTVTYVDIKPPAGETWLIHVDFYVTYFATGTPTDIYVCYDDYNGTTRRRHGCVVRNRIADYGWTLHVWYSTLKVLTNSLWASLEFYSYHLNTGYYGYSGFKLSEPHWSPVRVHNPEPKLWKRPLSKPLPPEIAPLRRYAYDILFIDTSTGIEEYDTAIILEENTPLAVDPNTNQPVELLTVVVRADVLANMIRKFKTGELDPVRTGYKKYLDKWMYEGIKLL
jgi:hypothetical protein